MKNTDIKFINILLKLKKTSIIFKLIMLHQIKATQFYMDFVSLKRADRKKAYKEPFQGLIGIIKYFTMQISFSMTFKKVHHWDKINKFFTEKL